MTVVPSEIIDPRTSALVIPTASATELVLNQQRYHEVVEKLLDSNDYQKIGESDFKKKSAWRKLSVAFGVNLEIVSVTHERDERGRIVRTEVIARATAPNGRFTDGLGACDLHEKCCPGEGHCRSTYGSHVHCTFDCPGHFSNPQHDIPATASTRATNRAASDLFGLGEVSAEEMTNVEASDDDWTARTQSNRQQQNSGARSGGELMSDAQRKKLLGDFEHKRGVYEQDDIEAACSQILKAPVTLGTITKRQASTVIDTMNPKSS